MAPDLLPTPVSRDGKGVTLHHKHRGGVSGLPDVSNWGKYAPAVRRWAEITAEPAPAPTDEQKRLNPDFVRWMMGYEPGWVDGISRTGQLRALGNAIVPSCAATAWGWLLGLDVTTTERERERERESDADSSNLGRERSGSARSRRDGPPNHNLPTPTAWLGRRAAHSIGDPERWLNPERSNELSDFVAWIRAITVPDGSQESEDGVVSDGTRESEAQADQ